MRKNLLVGFEELAPECCIVCFKDFSEKLNGAKFVYMAGSTPLGAMACEGECIGVAIGRWEQTGRVDVPDMRMVN